ncbi:Spindle assembly checkpoint protein [Klebsormidium nitens]|uniref:Spindle assembly checkpoint protein n=1 Tax=Klebsormidium nitens TaxID=105231 RepID=A0A1Y1HTG9_KLENI|nr:Spindle assembly checkpoint protein [Klebsormidium nitens]|eukprot:GAQ79837.1 Spindle assembly checkpoint protein [Klebsormidium nitens]
MQLYQGSSDRYAMKAETKELTDIVCEFLEVAIHLILHVRNVYPPEVFERRRYASVPVQWARHPELQEYIHSAVQSLHEWLMQGAVQRVVVVLRDGSGKAVEKFVIQVGPLAPHAPGSAPIAEIEEALRAVLMKLSVLEPPPEELPKDLSWEIVAHTNQPPAANGSREVTWVSADNTDLQEGPVITPIKSVKKGALQVQVYIEQLLD